MALNGILIVIFEMIMVNYFEERKAPITYILIGIFLTILAFIAMNLFPHEIWAALIVTTLFTFGEMFSFPFISTFWMIRAVPSNRGAYSAISAMSYSAALIIAPLFGAILVEKGGFNFSWWVLSAVSLVASIGLLVIKSINKNAA